MDPNFKYLCLSGGGSKGIAQLGALEFLSKNGLLQQIEGYSGTSIGSVWATLLCCGYTPSEIYTQILTIDLQPSPKEIDFIGILSNYGLITFHKFNEILRNIIRKKLDFVPTFRELYKISKKELHITSLNVTQNKVVYFSHKTYPNLDVVDAIRMSCNLPWIFTKIEFEGDLYTDGGLSDHIPHCVFGKTKNILAICISGKAPELEKFGGFVKYSYSIAFHAIKKLEKYQRDIAGENCFFIDILMEDNQLLNIIMSKEEKEFLFLKGFNTAKEWKEWLWIENIAVSS